MPQNTINNHLKTTRISFKDLEPDSFPIGLSAVSGDKLAGLALGGLLLDGKTIGASTGVAELEGTLVDASGVAAVAGPCTTGGLAIGAKGVAAGVEIGGGDIAGEILGDCEGDFKGEEDGDVTGALAGEVVGDLAGALAGEEVGDLEGEEDGLIVLDSEGADALSACTMKELEKVKARKTSNRKNLCNILSGRL